MLFKSVRDRNAAEKEVVGYVAWVFIPFKGRYKFKLAQVTELYNDSPNSV
jgi:hypothetical protein